MSPLSEFEELILLAVGIRHDDAYAFTIKQALEEHAGREVALASVHTALYRLENNGYVASEMGGATAERGGRRKRLFRLTHAGWAALRDQQAVRARMWQLVQPFNPLGGLT